MPVSLIYAKKFLSMILYISTKMPFIKNKDYKFNYYKIKLKLNSKKIIGYMYLGLGDKLQPN